MANSISGFGGSIPQFRPPPPQGQQLGNNSGTQGRGHSQQSSFQPAPGQRPPLPPPELMRDLGQALRIRPEQLAQKLMSGQSLTQVASSVGLDRGQLQSKIEGFLHQRLPNLPGHAINHMANGIIAGRPPRPPPLPQMPGTQG